MKPTLKKRLHAAFRSATVRRPRDLAGYGINRVQLGKAVAAGTMDELHHYARVCRVANVMRPYLESLA